MFFSKAALTLASLASMACATAAPSAMESGLEARTDFKCPAEMSYCPWTRACSCAPGKAFDADKSACAGERIAGAWPRPAIEVFASVEVELGAFCAASPYKIVKYDASHEYCQASLLNIAFLAPITIEAELNLLAGLEIDLSLGVSADLKAVVAGLAGLYLESVVDAVALFNTNKYGLGVTVEGVVGGISAGIIATVKGVTCKLGFGKCNYDCVSYCTQGCKNYIDVVGGIGGLINGLVGFVVLPDVILVVNTVGHIVTHVVERLLCIVGTLIKTLLTTFNCGCH